MVGGGRGFVGSRRGRSRRTRGVSTEGSAPRGLAPRGPMPCTRGCYGFRTRYSLDEFRTWYSRSEGLKCESTPSARGSVGVLMRRINGAGEIIRPFASRQILTLRNSAGNPLGTFFAGNRLIFVILRPRPSVRLVRYEFEAMERLLRGERSGRHFRLFQLALHIASISINLSSRRCFLYRHEPDPEPN